MLVGGRGSRGGCGGREVVVVGVVAEATEEVNKETDEWKRLALSYECGLCVSVFHGDLKGDDGPWRGGGGGCNAYPESQVAIASYLRASSCS